MGAKMMELNLRVYELHSLLHRGPQHDCKDCRSLGHPGAWRTTSTSRRHVLRRA